jgi:serine/threonine protein kinase
MITRTFACIILALSSFTCLYAETDAPTTSEIILNAVAEAEPEAVPAIQSRSHKTKRSHAKRGNHRHRRESKRLPSTYDEIKQVVKNRQFALLGQIIGKQLGSNFSLKELKNLAIEENCQPLIDAMEATTSIYNLDCGLSKKEIAQLALFLETRFSSYINKKQYYLSRDNLPIACPVQYDPRTKRRFIHLKGEIGKGSKKTVTRSILYDKLSPEMVARCMQSRKKAVSRERLYTKLAQGPGVVEAKAFTKHKSHGKTHYTLFSKLYKPGSLKKFYEEKPLKFTFKEKVQIALNIAKGIERMHAEKVVHRDLGTGNYLINITFGSAKEFNKESKSRSRIIDVVVADLGSAYPISRVRGERPQGHTIFTAPEGVFRDKMKGKDYLKTDVFAMGSMFYRILYGKIPTWQKVNYIKKAKGSPAERFRKLSAAVAKGTDKRRAQLNAKKKKGAELKPKAAFEKLIMQMCHKRAILRPTAAQVRAQLDKIMQKVDGKKTTNLDGKKTTNLEGKKATNLDGKKATNKDAVTESDVKKVHKKTSNVQR